MDGVRAVEAVARLVAPTATARGVDVKCILPDYPPQTRAEEADLQHALVNLLLNAIEASEEGSSVALEVLEGPPILIRVRDEGCGIPPDDLDRIFEPFVSLRRGGTGLGLFLSLDFVRRWDGEIRVESTPGQGSLFEINLPPLGTGESVEVEA